MKRGQNHSVTLKKRQVVSWISWLIVLAIYLFMPRNPTREWVGLILDLGITLIAIMEWFVVIESFSNKATRKDIVFHLFFAAYATFLFFMWRNMWNIFTTF